MSAGEWYPMNMIYIGTDTSTEPSGTVISNTTEWVNIASSLQDYLDSLRDEDGE